MSVAPGLFLDNSAVEELNGSVRVAGVAGIVRDHTNGGSFAMQFAKQIHDLLTIGRVEVARRLVRQKDGGLSGKSARHSHTLLLST